MTLKQLQTALMRPFELAAYFLSGFMPRSPRLVVFGSWRGQKFSDNAKWLFLYAQQCGDDGIRKIWLSRSPQVIERLRAQGFEAYFARGTRGAWFALRAATHVYDCYPDDTCWYLSRGSRRVNLWHGTPVKRIERDIDTPSSRFFQLYHGRPLQRISQAFRMPWSLLEQHLLLVPSAPVGKLLCGALGISADRTVVTGYARNDVLLAPEFEPSSEEAALHQKLRALRRSGTRVLAYVPTFREGASRSELPLDLPALSRFLTDRRAVLLLKLHSNDARALPSLETLPALIGVPPEVDLNPLLREVDLLISDYSSVTFDFLLLDRPIVFYAYDLDTYRAESRSLYFDYEQMSPGPKARTFEELLSALDAALGAGNDEDGRWSNERRRVCAWAFAQVDARAAERCWNAVRATLKLER